MDRQALDHLDFPVVQRVLEVLLIQYFLALLLNLVSLVGQALLECQIALVVRYCPVLLGVQRAQWHLSHQHCPGCQPGLSVPEFPVCLVYLLGLVVQGRLVILEAPCCLVCPLALESQCCQEGPTGQVVLRCLLSLVDQEVLLDQ
jgi:hypothetical protein